MSTNTEYNKTLNDIHENAKYLKLSYSFHNAKELIEEHTTSNSSIADFYKDLLQRETDIRMENGKENRIRSANFPYKKYLYDLDVNCLPEDAKSKLNILETLEFIKLGQNLILAGNPRHWKNTYGYWFGDKSLQRRIQSTIYKCTYFDKQT